MVRTRIAPSPTGEDIHIGNLYTALINWAYARKNSGKFIIRIEDTDRTRLIKGAEAKILLTIKAFGLNYDEGPDVGGEFAPYRQSERLELYKKYAEELVNQGFAYYCFCTKERLDKLKAEQIKNKKIPKYDRYCLQNEKNSNEKIEKGEKFVIRLKVPDNKAVIFNDLIRGEIKFDSNQLDDQILLKSDGYPTYHLAVVVDDHKMKISHVVRAEEWISSTPKHILLYNFFGWDLPVFAHLPILRNPDKSKLSKRKNPVWASWYLEQGFLPEAVLNYLALMGWSHPEQKEIFSLSEFVEKMDLKDILAVGPSFDLVKLTWMNGAYIRNCPNDILKTKLISYDSSLSGIEEGVFEKFLNLAKTRMKTLADFSDLVMPFLKHNSQKEFKNNNLIKNLEIELDKISDWNKENILNTLKNFVKENKFNFQDLYSIFINKSSGLPLADSFEILGKEKTLDFLK